MTNFEAIIDFGTKNLRLGVFDPARKNIYFSSQKIIESQEKSLNILIKNAEKHLSSHIDNVIVLYDSPKFYALDLCIRKIFDHSISIKKVYDDLIEEAQFFVSQNNFKDQIIHQVINNIIVDKTKRLNKINEDIKIKSLSLEIKFICLSKIVSGEISDKFKKNNLKISNLYCSSYIKTVYYNKKFDNRDRVILLDIGFERASSFIFNNKKFEFYNSISLGGNNITKDISKLLNLSLDYSEDLKTKFNKDENNNYFSQTNINKTNFYSEILKKNISIELLKKVIEARIDEIIELVVLKSDYIKSLNSIEKPKLVISGGGSQLFYSNCSQKIKKLISELIILSEKESDICKTGIDYHKSDQSFLITTKKRTKKLGFFETFFNLFSK